MKLSNNQQKRYRYYELKLTLSVLLTVDRHRY